MLGSAITIAAPIVPAISVEDARSFLRIDGVALDTEIELIVAAAIEDVEATTSTRLIEQTVRITADRFNDLSLLKIGPVSEVLSISYRDRSGAPSSVSGSAYELGGSYLEQSILAAPGVMWPCDAIAPISVDLVVGYGAAAAAVPAQLRWAVLALVRGKFEDRAVDIEPLIVNRRIYR